MNLAIWESGKLEIWKCGHPETWKSGNLVLQNLEICEFGNLEIEPALYVAVEVLDFQISRSFQTNFPEFEIFGVNFPDFQNEPG